MGPMLQVPLLLPDSSPYSIHLSWNFLDASAPDCLLLQMFSLYNPSLPPRHLTTFILFYLNVWLQPKEIIIMKSTVSNLLF